MIASFISDAQRELLIANGRRAQVQEDFDPLPVVKLFTPDAGATWLLTELDEAGEIAFGLMDLGLGSPEIGSCTLEELEAVRGLMNRPIRQDLHFQADKPLSAYAHEARLQGRIQA
ncbi:MULTISPECIES: DUF2958 domain-containing protein [unclassified Variovorax]|uniref:DUF2958 domain-containing protein n=1 Tax=unclassified Variovorax TaxID=663243 RepID=UPI001BD6896F|nr:MULTISPECIES: DUF2958 domain-containing protein [unclassified Variovorax]